MLHLLSLNIFRRNFFSTISYVLVMFKKSPVRGHESAPPSKWKREDEICILHDYSIAEHGHFKPLEAITSALQDKLNDLLSIRNMRRQCDFDSPHQMEAEIPKSLPPDIAHTGYHTVCYKNSAGMSIA